MHSDSDHLGESQLAKLLEEFRQNPKRGLEGTEIHPHFAVCSECREQFQALSSFDGQLKSMKPSESAPRQNDCPSDETWREIAGGLTPPDWTLSCVEHASRCNHCGALLRGAVVELSALNGEVTDSERKHIASLESARVEWQQRLGQRIAGSSQSGADRKVLWWRQWFTLPRLATAGVSLLAVIAAGSWFVVHRRQPAAAGQLLARAYTEKRTLELRIADAAYAPLRVSLGPAASFTSRPPALLKAEALIASQLGSHPLDPTWLRAEAQADVLEGKYDAAVQALRRALELQPHSPALLIDLATAYFQRAQQEDRKEDFGAAYEYLSQALQVQPDNPVALFNRAIVAEHQFLYQQALDDWEHYLKVDPASPWSDEARNRANAVREKLKEHQSKATPLLAPAELVAMASASRDSQVDERVEEYLHEAVRSWLPRAFPEIRANADPDARQALFFLAGLTQRKHGDRWLADLLGGSSDAGFSSAVNALARAVQANDAGEFDVSRQQAERAEKLFRASGNAAGALRAEFERTFADQISRRSEDCRRRAIAAGVVAKRYSYPWVQIQLALEESVCSELMGDLGNSEESARRAQDHAQQVGYDVLYLRALHLMEDGKITAGDRSGAWKLVAAGLERYWLGRFPAMRGYSLYTDGAWTADAAGQSNLQLAHWREAVALIDTDEDLLLRAEAHSNMAEAAKAAHQPTAAEYQYGEAGRLFAVAPQTEATRVGRIEIETRNAQLEAGQGAFDAALDRLTRVQDEVRQLSNNYLAQIFYSTLGEVQLGSHHAAEAEQAFRPAMRLAEQNLASLTSEAERTSWSKDVAPVYLGLAEAELVQGREQEALDVFEWYLGAPQRVGTRGRIPSKTTHGLPQSVPDPTRLTARLPLLSNQTVLAYGVLPDGLAIWVYDNRGVSAKWIPKSPQGLQDRADSFYARCAEPGSELAALRNDSQTLYALLFAPIEERLDPKRTLVIETEGFLARFPFEALVDARGNYLIERGPIVHSPGLYAEGRLHPEGAITPDLPALVVGSTASAPDAGLFDIPNFLVGTDKVATAFHFPRVLKGSEATMTALTSALPAAGVFHFAGHAITIPSHTGLMLEGRDVRTGAPVLLEASAVRNLNLRNLQLAVLAACSTDSGEGGSRGFDSVAEALQTSGVPHVVASRWAVDAVESSAFMDSFYHSLLSGQSVSAATRGTSQKMLQNPQTAHPYHWAAFAAYGRS